MAKKLGKAMLLGATMLMSVGLIAGCSSQSKEAQDELNETGLNELNTSSVVREATEEEFGEFRFLCADFDRNGEDKLDVDVSGVAKFKTGGKQAYVTMSYTFDDKNFISLRSDEKIAILRALNKAMKNSEMKAFDYAPVKSVKEMNSTLKKTAESPIDDYDYNKGIIFSVGKINFDEENGMVSFQMKTHVKYQHAYNTYQPILINDMITIVPIVQYEYEDFFHVNDVYLPASKAEIELMKEDKTLIFEKFISAVKNDEKEGYVINSVEVDKAQDFDVSVLQSIELAELE